VFACDHPDASNAAINIISSKPRPASEFAVLASAPALGTKVERRRSIHSAMA
jgi:hypothetical protein